MTFIWCFNSFYYFSMTEVILMLLELSLVMTSVQTAAALVSIVQQSVGEGSFEVIGSCKEKFTF